MTDLWNATFEQLDILRGINISSNDKKLVNVGMLVLKTLSAVVSLAKKQVNQELQGVEPVYLVAITAFFFILIAWIRKLITYNDFVPSNKRTGWLERIRKLPFLRCIVERQLKLVGRNIEKDLKKDFVNSPFKTVLPQQGHDVVTIVNEVRDYLNLSKINWKTGSVSGAIYSPNDLSCEQLMLQVYQMTMKSNHLHADVFSGVRKMEAELIRWVINLFNGDAECCGSISSGGTESILLACKAYRDFAMKTRGIVRPEIVIPVTAHAAFDKAADWLQLEIRKVPIDPKTMKVDTRKMRKMMSRNVVMIVGSAPNYPHGIVDPIEEIAQIGERWNVPVHVDCCLGGFIMPFMDSAGFPVQPFDFRLKGVTSISADTHKYAMAPKGTSVIMYSNKKYLHCQFSVAQDWPGGIYITPTISGSRPGAAVACCWATLRYYGYDGYVRTCAQVITEARKVRDGIREFKELQLLGDPEAMVVAFTSDKLNIFELNSRLGVKHWHLNPLQFPSGIHFCFTAIHTQNNVAERFLKDLRETVSDMLKEPSSEVSPQAAVYGLAQTIPDRSLVKEILFNYMDVVYSTEDYKGS
ncbi:sphingosine-1-phosphate lyase-like [Varroa destructor]|uniref:sphinganine-1-phosphate aldolase n=1 Tax=Varroa destructor TaxID=109461 RepID=A0A7M7JQV0_VARDE|nr:sphingosine-1-phosphate lyase-like [Varroa destructor]XP_022655720.1 sphingosine-1-phosphate lyase-like [Varroa destructor]XP_022655721.1 sphingosine-1-phosphate lyase-like [Varroa destructor]